MAPKTTLGATTIGTRIADSLEHLSRNEYERACIHLFPALDATSRKRRDIGVGARIRKFIAEYEAIISAVATPGVFVVGNRIDGMSLADAIYKFGRTSIAHEGRLDERLSINPNAPLIHGGSRWNLPPSYLLALCVCVIIAPENVQESCSPRDISFWFGSQSSGRLTYKLSEIWGAESQVVSDLTALMPAFERNHRIAVNQLQD